jgi:hypothetical protein
MIISVDLAISEEIKGHILTTEPSVRDFEFSYFPLLNTIPRTLTTSIPRSMTYAIALIRQPIIISSALLGASILSWLSDALRKK